MSGLVEILGSCAKAVARAQTVHFVCLRAAQLADLPAMDVLSECIGMSKHIDHVLHIPSVPGADGLVEDVGIVKPGKRASEARMSSE